MARSIGGPALSSAGIVASACGDRDRRLGGLSGTLAICDRSGARVCEVDAVGGCKSLQFLDVVDLDAECCVQAGRFVSDQVVGGAVDKSPWVSRKFQ